MSHVARLCWFVVALLGLSWLALSGRAEEPSPSTPVAVGKPAPRFRLNDQAGEVRAPVEAAVAANRWLVLAFFPKAMTPG